MAADNPGSLISFAESRGLPTSDTRTKELYSMALSAYRLELAVELGITEEELHQGGFQHRVDSIGELALGSSVKPNQITASS